MTYSAQAATTDLAGRDTLVAMETPGSVPSAEAAPDTPVLDGPVSDAPVTDAAVPDNTVQDNTVQDNTVPDDAGSDAPQATSGPVWRFLIQPRWLGWHLFVVVAFWGMLWLGDWQFRRAMSGNGLSWAYTFEWPMFAVFGVVFWARTIRDEFRLLRGTDLTASAGDDAVGPVLPVGIGTRPIDEPGDDADDAELASYNAYLAKLNAEVKGHNKWLGRN
jgi:hypothetical protein